MNTVFTIIGDSVALYLLYRLYRLYRHVRSHWRSRTLLRKYTTHTTYRTYDAANPSMTYSYRTYTASSPASDIDSMSGQEFERFLASLFQEMGYDVRLTPGSSDYGADLILNKGTECIVVQAKRHSQTVGIKAVQEVAAAVPYYNGTRGMVVTNAQFSPNAIELARKLHIELWDGARLNRAIQNSHLMDAGN